MQKKAVSHRHPYFLKVHSNGNNFYKFELIV